MRENRRRLGFQAIIIATLVAAGLLVPGIARAAACFGPPITTSVTLSSDITDCADNGIEVGANGLTINLNGRTVDGDDDDEDSGILIDGFNGTKIVGPGTIQQFGSGIFGIDTNKTNISNVTVTDNVDPLTGGIVVTRNDIAKDDRSEDTVVKDSTITLNEGTGILIHRSSIGSRITGNDVEDNGGDGIALGGAGDELDLEDGTVLDADEENIAVHQALVDDNDVTGNGVTGIVITAEGANNNVITNNTASGNGSPDLHVGSADTGHEHREGDDPGGHGIKVAGDFAGLTITGNTANDNGPGAACSERNGAGIFVAGDGSGIKVNNNTTDDNALSGVFVAGEHSGLQVKNNPSIDGNLLNCDEEGAVMLTGAIKNITVSGNPAITNNAGAGIYFEGHNKSMTIENNNTSDNVGTSGGDDNGGILVRGRSVDLRVSDNVANNNSDSGGVSGHGIEVRGSVGGLQDDDELEALFKNNQANDNEGSGIRVLVETSQPCVGKPDGGDADSDPECPSLTHRDPQPESADNDCDPDADDTPNIPSDCPDRTVNRAGNIRIAGNTTNDNGADGIFAVADVTFANNTANNNTGFGILHEPDALARGGDSTDGPHKKRDDGGNSATGNGTDCSPGITC